MLSGLLRPSALAQAASLLRGYAVTANSAAEKAIADKLVATLKVQDLRVEDTSGGCGAMYRIAITADDFK